VVAPLRYQKHAIRALPFPNPRQNAPACWRSETTRQRTCSDDEAMLARVPCQCAMPSSSFRFMNSNKQCRGKGGGARPLRRTLCGLLVTSTGRPELYKLLLWKL
jgi:hypothetical protein